MLKWIVPGLGLTVAGVVAVAALAGGGVAAQTPPDGSGKTYDEYLAEKLGVSVDRLKAAREEARVAMIDDAVAAGRLTPERAEELKERDLDGRPGPGPRVVAVLRNLFSAAAEVIGISRDELGQELRDGNTLAEIASGRGIERGDFINRLGENLDGRIDEALRNGDITQEQADRLHQAVDEHLDEAVDREAGSRFEKGLRRGGPFRR